MASPFPRIGKVFPPGRRRGRIFSTLRKVRAIAVCAFGCRRCCPALPRTCLPPDCASQDSFRRVLRVVSPSVFCRRGCSGAQWHPGESAVGVRGTLICKTGFPGAPVAVALPGPQAAGSAPVVPANDLIVSCRVFTRVITGMRKGQMPPRNLCRPGPGLPGAAMIFSAAPGLFRHGSCRSGGGESFPAVSRRLPPCPARCVPPVLRWPRGRPGVAARLRFCKRVLHGRCRPWPFLRAGPQAAGVRIGAGAQRCRRRRLYPGPAVRYCTAGHLRVEPDRRGCHHPDRHHGDPPGAGLQRWAMKRKKR